MNLLGKYVRNKESGDIGIITYSSFGYSIHSLKVFNDDGIDKVGLVKCLGDTWTNHSKHWNLIKALPKEVDEKFKVFGIPTTSEIWKLYWGIFDE